MIATEWKEFKDLDWEDIYDNMNKPAFLFDGRLLVDSEKLTKIGFKVCSFTISYTYYFYEPMFLKGYHYRSPLECLSLILRNKNSSLSSRCV